MNMQEKLNNNNNNNCKKKNKGNKEDSNTIASQFCHWIRYHTRTIIGKELERNQYITLLKANSRAREIQVTLNMNMFCFKQMHLENSRHESTSHNPKNSTSTDKITGSTCSPCSSFSGSRRFFLLIEHIVV